MHTKEIITSHHSKDTMMNIALTATSIERNGIPSWVYKASVGNEINDFNQQLKFHVGNPKVYGVNGFTNETLIAVLLHRLEDFQNNQNTNCVENQIAIEHLKLAMEALHSRTERFVDSK